MSYSFGNYIANLLNALPLLILPILITNLLNPTTTAYYYIAMTLGGLLFIIPQATCQSFFAESSKNDGELMLQIKKSIKLLSLIMLPTIVIIIILGKYILLIFGSEYSEMTTRFLQVIAISGVFVTINYLSIIILRIKFRIISLILITFLGSSIIILLSVLFISHGLMGIGYAWIIGQFVMTILFLFSLFSMWKKF